MHSPVIPLKRAITRRYLLAVALIAVLSTLALYSLLNALQGSDSTAYLVNLSGKQRMLSQHVALDLHRIYNVNEQLSGQLKAERQAAVRLLIEEMRLANQRLSTGRLSDENQVTLSPAIAEMYFGVPNLAQRVDQYLMLADRLVSVEEPETYFVLLADIDALTEPLLMDLNQLVEVYQQEGEAKLKNIERLEVVVWLATLFTLLMEVFFIFRPLVRKILKMNAAQAAVLENLNNLVELRTLKLEKANQKLQRLAQHDPLTGLKNRLTMEHDIEALLMGYQQHHMPFAVVMMDIDWFKKVNDQYGHVVGDFVLKELAELLHQVLRESDQVYRTGGEEFVLVFNRVGLAEVAKLLEGLRRKIAQHAFDYDGLVLRITSSFGLYHSDLKPVESVNDCLLLADNALYESKAQGRNRITQVGLTELKALTVTNTITTKLVFSDFSLNVVNVVDYDIEHITGFSARDYLSAKHSFIQSVYEADLHLFNALEAKCHASGEFQATIRIVTANDTIKICRLEVQHQAEGVLMTLQSTIGLDKIVGDDLLVHNFHSMLDHTDDLIYFKDLNHVFTAGSASLVPLTTVNSRAELVGKTDYDVFAQHDADQYFAMEKRIFSGEAAMTREFQPTLDSEGHQGWIDRRIYPIVDFHGEVIGLFGMAHVISDAEYVAYKEKAR